MVRVGCELLERWLDVILAKLLFVVELQYVFKLLVGHKTIPVFINGPDRLHDLH